MLTYPTVTSITVDPPLSPHKLQSLSRTRRREMPTSIATRTPPHTAFADTSHSYITHLIEFDYPEKFVSTQVGHTFAATTAIYTGVSDEYRNRMLRRSLSRHSALWEGDDA